MPENNSISKNLSYLRVTMDCGPDGILNDVQINGGAEASDDDGLKLYFHKKIDVFSKILQKAMDECVSVARKDNDLN